MAVKLILALAAILTVAGCAAPSLPKLTALKMPAMHDPEPTSGDPLTFCPKDDPCRKVANRRQYFDQRDNRYYYFDQTQGRYYWENGQARFLDGGSPTHAP